LNLFNKVLAYINADSRNKRMQMDWPKHHQLYVTHNPHHTNYETVEQYFENEDNRIDIHTEDIKDCIRLGEIWEVQWYPITPMGFYCVAAASLERCLEIINSQEWK
jgi:hypothetical protein